VIIAIAVVMALLAVLAGVLLAAFDRPLADADRRPVGARLRQGSADGPSDIRCAATSRG
jgi:hypothetical protein